MTTVPIPFVVAFLLVILGVRLSREDFAPRAFLALLASCALSSVVVGLRWGFQVEWARAIQPITAASLPPLTWMAYISLMGPIRPAQWIHASGVVLVTALTLFWRAPLDLVLFALFLGYGVALILSARRHADRLEDVPFGQVGLAQRAVQWVGWMWVLSAMVEAAIGVDFLFGRGQQASHFVAVAGTLHLLVLGWIMTSVGRSLASQDRAVESKHLVPPASGIRAEADKPEADHVVHGMVLQTFDRLMAEQRLFLDPSLTLNRIARRAGIPARQISSAINAAHRRNVSQVVNEYRVAEAKRRLVTTAEPVTSIMLDAGFQTKSNFNREFRRVTGLSPSEYRARGGDAPDKH